MLTRPLLLATAGLAGAARSFAVPGTHPGDAAIVVRNSPSDVETRSDGKALESRLVPEAVKFIMYSGNQCGPSGREFTRSDVYCHPIPSGQAMNVYYIAYTCRGECGSTWTVRPQMNPDC